MGRRESPLDPDAGPVQRFADELRALRRDAGGPTYRTMAARGEYSVTTLAQAAAGERLPSLPVLRAYVAACGGDEGEWERRWREAGAEAAAVPSAADDEPAPYLGLARFEPDDRERFFGREQLTGDLLAVVAENRFAALVGASGSGKSSLLRAGLIPALQHAEEPHRRPAAIRILTPGAHPLAAHAAALSPADGDRDTVVVIDQFEETFTLCRSPAERAEFIDRLLAARRPDSRLRVVIAVRADFYGRCAEHRALAAALRGTSLLVGPMSQEELRQAIVGPAATRGALVERSLTARLVTEVTDEPGGLPLLSHALLETWRRRKGRALTESSYEAAGGLRGAIAHTGEEVYARLTPGEAAVARHLLLRLITPGEGAPDTRRPAERAELLAVGPGAAPVLERLARARLITLEESSADLAHEALITAWPRLSGWVEEDRERLRLHRRLTDAANAWEESGRDTGALYRGSRLAAAEEAFAGRDGGKDGRKDGEYEGKVGEVALTGHERAFLAAAVTARARERRRNRSLLGTLSVLLVLALVAGVIAWQQNRTSDKRRTEAVGRRISSLANGMRFSDPVAAMRLSVAAWRVADTPETRAGLMGARTQPEEDVFTAPESLDSQEFLSRDGRTLVVADRGRVTKWDVRTKRRTGTYPGLGRRVGTAVHLSPDARGLLLETDDGVLVWDIGAGRTAGGRVGPPTAVGLGFGPSVRTVALGGGAGGRASVWDTERRRALFTAPADQVEAAVVSPDERLVALCPAEGGLQVWDMAARRRLPVPRSLPRGGSDTCAEVRFAPDSRTVAAVTPDAVRVWRARTGKTLPGIDQVGLRSVEFGADGKFVVTADAEEISLWRLSDAENPVLRYPVTTQSVGQLSLDLDDGRIRYLSQRRMRGGVVRSLALGGAAARSWLEPGVSGAAFGANGRLLLRSRQEADGTARFELYDVSSGRRTRELPRLRCTEESVGDCMQTMAFSGDGRTVAYRTGPVDFSAAGERIAVRDVAAGGDRTPRTLRVPGGEGPGVLKMALSLEGRSLFLSRGDEGPTEVYDVRTGKRVRVLRGMGGDLAVRPDGKLLVSASGRVADLRSGRVTRVGLGRDTVGAVAFSPDGRLFAAGDTSGRVTLWDDELRRRLGEFDGTFTSDRQDLAEPADTLAFSPDGRTLAVGGGPAGTLRLWDTTANQALGTALPTPGDWQISLSFSPDSAVLYAAGEHVPLQRYRVHPRQVAAEVCDRAGTGLSRRDWKTYISDVPYRPTC
ncbi:hypothetical protein [Streptomyces silvensis]|uniref:Novel STAND NTPase 1 domain-containing protein n=1 Tax=Streptomyces silvensis TaxID=1765722 RepID=A0A0W7X5X7_9ACTN|nr:hypothetical protein [Streptomyces silvensis]KUF18313.1 hypothetical protein AT728_24855 [Streptomyces silvensis]